MQAVSTTTKVVGPIFVVFGLCMFLAGLLLCVVSWKLGRDEREISYMQKRIASAGPTALLRSAPHSASAVWGRRPKSVKVTQSTSQ